ncbi:transcriptional regulator [Alishewanella longhuensis]|uniref:Transcriptional regulator n=1 Tax=Alishewanella longhuensis TaxID=1091037 RepID=A0ABQ3KXR4_9ALTE|nr:helix-turn-helix transcriptional regulator [Alishewanella longhuensis]GHG67642.1 transcriptional regulator [Alishewanella longhuensis]
MTQGAALVQTLKRALKQHGCTYAQVAEQLQLSEASVKRMFSQQQFTLQRLEQICQLLAMDFSDLLRLLQQEQGQISQLTEQQELELTADLGLLLVAVSVLNHWTIADIVKWYQFTPSECLQKLIKLDRLQLIELQPGNRVKLRIAANFSWRDNGPIQRFFQQQLAVEFFNHRFNGQDEALLVLNGMLSTASNQEFQRKLTRLAREFNELVQHDSQLPLAHRYGVSVVLALRNWRFGVFKDFLRPDAPG